MSMERYSLSLQSREELGKKVHNLRREGIVPVVVYGHGEPVSASVNRLAFEKVYRKAHGSHIVDVTVGEGAAVPTLIHDVQYDALTDQVIHADFLRVNLKEKVSAEVKLEFTGESAAVKAMGGTLLRNIDSIRIRCLPTDLIDSVAVDISALATFEDKITLRDLSLPSAIEIEDADMDQIVALVNPPRTDEELASLEKAVEENVATIETVKKEKKEDDAEGDTTTA